MNIFFKILVLFSFTLLSFVTMATYPTQLTRPMYKNFPNSFSQQDFFIKQSSMKNIKKRLWNSNQENCRDHIAKVVCLVEPTQEGEDPEHRTCLAGSEMYAHYFEQIFDAYPPTLQKMFCSLNHIFIEKKFFGTAYASPLVDSEGNMIGAMMGIRQSVLDENLNLSTWASWKEQLSFGGIADSYTITPHLPTIETQSKAPNVNDFLYFVVAHEFGHFFDFANQLNHSSCGKKSIDELDNNPACSLTPESWGALSWRTFEEPWTQYDFIDRAGLCFYQCEGHFLNQNRINSIYLALDKTNFISTYAATNPWDDFADSLAYYLMNQNLGTNYTLHTQQGLSFDILWKLHSPLFAKKLQYIETFLNRSDIRYP